MAKKMVHLQQKILCTCLCSEPNRNRNCFYFIIYLGILGTIFFYVGTVLCAFVIQAPRVPQCRKTILFQIQDSEEKKLRTTVKLQLARQKVQDNESDDAKDNVRFYLREINDTKEEINDSMEEIRYLLADMREEMENDAVK